MTYPIVTPLWRFISDLAIPFIFKNRLSEHGEQICPDVWYNRCEGDFSIANVFEQLIRHDANVPDGAIWGDKSPSYLNHIESIRAIYPTTKFIHLIRDARDYVLSLEKAFGKNKLRAAQRWNDAIFLAKEEGERLGTDFIEVRYEDLVDAPHREACRLCTFLELDFEAGMTALQRATENLGDTKGAQQIVVNGIRKIQNSNGSYRTEGSRILLCRRLRTDGIYRITAYGFEQAFDFVRTKKASGWRCMEIGAIRCT